MEVLIIFFGLGMLIFIIWLVIKKRRLQSHLDSASYRDKAIVSAEPIFSVTTTGTSKRYSVAETPNIVISEEFAGKTKAEIAEIAFDHVFKTIECDEAIKQKIRKEYVDALVKRQYDRYYDILRFNLTGIDFRWRWFDDWKQRFTTDGKWPEAWRGINYEAIAVPENIHAVLEFVKVAEIRKALKTKGLEKIPTTRIQVQELALKHLKVEDLQEAIKERVKYFEALRDKNNGQAILGLIARTIDHAQSQLSELVDIMQIKHEKPHLELRDIVYLSPSWNDDGLDRWVLEQVGSSVSDSIFPPYYPGDSISIRIEYSARY